ncbi:MAG: GTPase [Planctomycetota bacterium]
MIFKCDTVRLVFIFTHFMPANLTPEYHKADERFRAATTSEEKILALEEMLRVIPKHKGTEHMRADLRRKLSKFKEIATQKKKGSRGIDVFHVHREGSGQVVLLGMPNCGKSTIVGALTNARVNITDFPFATALPVPGMAKYEDVSIQLVDMPPITADYVAGEQVGTYRNCDLIAIVIDLSSDVFEQMQVCLNFLDSRQLWVDEQTGEKDVKGNTFGKKAFVVCTKADLAEPGTMEALKQLCKQPFDFVEVSVASGRGLDKLCEVIYRQLGILRIYSKKPGKPADMTEPFTLPTGSTVLDLARAIHRELAERLKSARAWGTGVYDGQNVHRTHILHDKDIIELHFS